MPRLVVKPKSTTPTARIKLGFTLKSIVETTVEVTIKPITKQWPG